MVETIYQYNETNIRGYDGILLDQKASINVLKKEVKDRLIDRTQRDEFFLYLKAKSVEAGFEKSKTFLADIQALSNEHVDVQEFRVAEALAEVVLQHNFNCKFYWNELRDTRNPKGNKTGADLVGFIKVDNEVLFLFGEVKSSSELQSPPQVMTNATGIEKQLMDLYSDQRKRFILISYIANKADLSQDFKRDFDEAIKSYYKVNDEKYLLYGVLVRDTEPNENDVKESYEKLKCEIIDSTGLKLLAIYLPIPKSQWLNIINGENHENN